MLSTCIDHGQSGRYAMAKRAGKLRGKHVYVLMDKTGEEPNGRLALHTCDNHRCVNPEHLYWGTQKQNMRDRLERTDNYRRKLTCEQVRAIREHPHPHTVNWGVNGTTVSRAKNRQLYQNC